MAKSLYSFATVPGPTFFTVQRAVLPVVLSIRPTKRTKFLVLQLQHYLV
jgi:hypothetical protein